MNLDVQEHVSFTKHMLEPKMTVNMAQTLAKEDVAELKGQIARLKRFVSSSWQIVGVAQSRFNHLQKNNVGQI
jgi:hypothetical protein